MKQQFLKVKDNPDLVRERSSKAVLNTNKSELNKYRQVREEKLKLKSLMEDQERMRYDIDEIKALLKQLVGQSN
jgi:hypothetical protein